MWTENDLDQFSGGLVEMFVSVLVVGRTDGDVVLVGLFHDVSILDTVSWTAVVTCVRQLCASCTEVQ